MKLISAMCVGLTVAAGALTLKYTAPMMFQNGSSVIYTMTHDGKNGNKPVSIKLPNEITDKQADLLNFAYDVAKSDGIKQPKFLQGILMQESRLCTAKDYRVAGLSNREGDRYFGCGQIKLVAAKSVMIKYPEMWEFLDTKTDEELQARLILDDKFNIRVASKYMLLMGINENSSKAIAAYNMGPQGVKTVDPKKTDYFKRVSQHSEVVTKNIRANQRGLQSVNKPQLAMLSEPKY